MKRLLLLVVMGVAGLPMAVRATDVMWRNTTNVFVAPVIDALNVVNEAGAIMSFSAVPFFDTSNTRNYTNKGTINVLPGWRFDTAPSTTGVRRMANSFRNHSSGSIAAALNLGNVPGLVLLSGITPSVLHVNATNVINEGTMIVDPVGLLKIEGKNVNLSRGGLQVNRMAGYGSLDLPNNDGIFTNFLPDIGTIDNYWGWDTNEINTAAIADIIVGPPDVVIEATSPVVPVDSPVTGGIVIGAASVTAIAPYTFVHTNTSPPTEFFYTNSTGGLESFTQVTNRTVQVAFVSVFDPSVTVFASFYPALDPRQLLRTISVEIHAFVPNVVTGADELMSLYLVDRLATSPARYLVPNLYDATFRPANYTFSRQPITVQGGFPLGANFPVTQELLYDPPPDEPFYTNPVVTAVMAAYSGTADFIAEDYPLNLGTGSQITNVPGRIEIKADSLNMSRARFRGEGLATIETPNLISSSNANVDAWNLSFNLGASNNNLNIVDLAKPQVGRFGGRLDCWSGLWTNAAEFYYTNHMEEVESIEIPDPDDPGGTNVITVSETNWVPTIVTNLIRVGIHALIVDASTITTEIPVLTHQLITHGSNVVLRDFMNLMTRFETDAQNFTIAPEGGLQLGPVTIGPRQYVGELQSISAQNTPNLLYFTNLGALFVSNEEIFGDDRITPLAAFVNRGTNSAASIAVRSTIFENSAPMMTTSLLSVNTVSGKMEGGSMVSFGDVRIHAGALKLTGAAISALARVDLSVTNNLSDSGAGSGNSITTRDGFNLIIKPTVGDLLGTTFQSSALPFAAVVHFWAAEDRGATPAGFLNNAAIGQLVLTPQGFDPLFVFSGTGEANGLYVDNLDLTQIDDIESALQIDPNIVIYFASATLGFVPPAEGGVPQQPEEFLDGMFEGRLRWVSDFAGPNSSIDAIVNGQSVQVNRGLRNSRLIDSDGDGVPNFFDFNPFDPGVAPLRLTGVMAQTPPPVAKAFEVTWTAAANTAYRVEYTTNMPFSNWQYLLNYTNNAPTNRVITIRDPNASPTSAPRYYRVAVGF